MLNLRGFLFVNQIITLGLLMGSAFIPSIFQIQEIVVKVQEMLP